MIHIACNIDSNYVRHCAVTLVSLFENNKKEQFMVHVIADNLQESLQKTLENLCAQYQNHIAFYPPSLELLKGFEIKKFSKRISMATYYRCLLSDILPRDIERVLYLDCDIVVLGNIRPFYDIALDDIGAAAVEDTGCKEAHRYDILQYPMEYSYFNAGVLLINLEYWRTHNVPKACADYFHKYPERILFNDQDLLNSLLYQHKTFVPLKWNMQDGFYRNTKAFSSEWYNVHAEELKHPVILPYTNRKPWDYDSQHPLRNEYFKYLDLTPWKGERPWHSPVQRIKRFFRLLPFHAGLRKPKYINLTQLKERQER